jgi:hypothetical protein
MLPDCSIQVLGVHRSWENAFALKERPGAMVPPLGHFRGLTETIRGIRINTGFEASLARVFVK